MTAILDWGRGFSRNDLEQGLPALEISKDWSIRFGGALCGHISPNERVLHARCSPHLRHSNKKGCTCSLSLRWDDSIGLTMAYIEPLLVMWLLEGLHTDWDGHRRRAEALQAEHKQRGRLAGAQGELGGQDFS